MPASPAATNDTLLREFDAAWRDETPVFGCCRKAVEAAVEQSDVIAVAPLDATARVQSLRDAVEQALPEHLDSHRCCAGHIADLAFDLPDLLAPAQAEPDVDAE